MSLSSATTSSQGNFWAGLLFLAILIGTIVMFVRLSRKRTRGKYWIGSLIDKKIVHSTDDDGDTTYTHTLVVSMDGLNKPKKLTVSGALFAQFNVGDRIEKKLGDLHPTKASQPESTA